MSGELAYPAVVLSFPACAAAIAHALPGATLERLGLVAGGELVEAIVSPPDDEDRLVAYIPARLAVPLTIASATLMQWMLRQSPTVDAFFHGDDEEDEDDEPPPERLHS